MSYWYWVSFTNSKDATLNKPNVFLKVVPNKQDNYFIGIHGIQKSTTKQLVKDYDFAGCTITAREQYDSKQKCVRVEDKVFESWTVKKNQESYEQTNPGPLVPVFNLRLTSSVVL